MPTAHWREEKAGRVVEAICRTLASPQTPQTTRDSLAPALWDALKLLADAIAERLSDGTTKMVSRPSESIL